MPARVVRGEGLLRALRRPNLWLPDVAADIEAGRAEQLAAEVKRIAPKDTGKGVRAVKHRGNHVLAPLHVHVISEGRRPGAKQPPTKALRGWVRRRWGVSGREVGRAAFVLARSIGRKGIRPRRFYRASVERTRFGKPHSDIIHLAGRSVNQHLRRAARRGF